MCVCVYSPRSESKKNEKIVRRRSTPKKTPERHTAPAEGLMNYPGDQSALKAELSEVYMFFLFCFVFFLFCPVLSGGCTLVETTLNLNNGPCSLIFSPVSRNYFQLSKWHHLAFCLVEGTTQTHTHTHTHWRSTHFFFFFCRGRCGHWLWWLIQNAGFDTSRI